MILEAYDNISSIKDWQLTDQEERQDILAGKAPVVLRGLVGSWPLVKHSKTSFGDMIDYLLGFDKGVLYEAMLAAPSEKGRLFYGRDLEHFNFDRMNGYLRDAFEILNSLSGQKNCPTFYIGSKEIPQYLPGLENDCRVPFLDELIIPNIWIGNRTVVAAHNDDSENIACIAAGRRRFILFPPDQVNNLYIANADISPGGRPISLVNLKAPDFVAFPRFSDALATAQVATLEAGDALYIPTNWWHHVEALDDVNILINYWWRGAPPALDSVSVCS